MRITAFWAKGYRSLVDVHLDDLGPFNVFYGPNGAGKSNILAAMRTLFRLLAWRSSPEMSFEQPGLPIRYTGSTKILHSRDRSRFPPNQQMILGARIEETERDEMEGMWPIKKELMLEVTYGWFKEELAISRFDWVLPRTAPSTSTQVMGERFFDTRMHSFAYQVTTGMYELIDANRVPRREKLTSPTMNIPATLAAGKLKEGLFRASTHPSPELRRRFAQLQELLAGPPLHRPPFALVHDAYTGIVELVESTSIVGSGERPTEVPLDLAGLGIAQIYSILGQALLRAADAVGIEEPEAHLHAPTSGLHLRQLLERLVNENYLDQIFIATHSNLFDLDPKGYYDVSLDERGATRIERKPLPEIDRRHLYEPGPAKHALADFLSYMEADEVVFRRPDGSPVSAGEMLEMLQHDDPVAVEFLRDVHGAALRAVRVRHSKRPAPSQS